MAETDTPRNMEKEILGKSLIYSFSLYIRLFVKLLSGIFIAKLLGPSLFGLKNAYDLARQYESNSDLGVFGALNRLAPYYRGEKDYDKVHAAISSAYSVNLCYAVVAAIIAIIVSRYLKYNGYAQVYVDFVFFFGLMIFTGKLHEYLHTKLRIDHNFYELSVNNLIYGLMVSVLGVVFVYFWSFRGLLISLVVTEVACIGHLMLKEKKFPKIKISSGSYGTLLKIGFPMMVLFLLLMLLANADRTLILAMISEEALGYFGIATVATGIIATIPGAIHSVTLTPVMEKLGRTKDILSIRHYLREPMVIMAYLLPVLIALIYFAIHLPIKYYLDQYAPSISVVKVLVIGIYFQSVSSPILSVCLALNKQIHLICLVVPMVVLNFILNYTFIVAGWGIIGVAAGTSITFFITFCILLYFASVQFGESLQTYLESLLMILLPFIYASVLIVGLDTYIDPVIHNIWFDVMITLIKITVFMICYSVMLYRIRKHSGFIKLYTNLRLLSEKFFPRGFKRNPR